MEAGGITPAGASRALRLDPFTLPVRFPAKDAGADGQIRQVELGRERVVLRRAVCGIRMAVGVPVAAFRGVVLRLLPEDGQDAAAIAVVLDHRDAGLSVPLFIASDGDEIVAVWKSWGRVLGLPLLLAERDGKLHEPFPRLGGVGIAAPAPRRRRHSPLKRRRPSLLLRRKPGRPVANAAVHRHEREIIARN
jgi:uncharacterized protein DUF6101